MRMRKSIQAYAALRTGQDLMRPEGNFGAFYSRLVQRERPTNATHMNRFAIIRQAQEQARPIGNFGAFYFKRQQRM